MLMENQINLEAYRSGHNGPDSKSGSPHGLVGSNPTASVHIRKRQMPCGENRMAFVFSLTVTGLR